jgi:hypothetical protein
LTSIVFDDVAISLRPSTVVLDEIVPRLLNAVSPIFQLVLAAATDTTDKGVVSVTAVTLLIASIKLSAIETGFLNFFIFLTSC